ncbi:MAG: hypothetical protein A4E63_02230 [Syntrophorhabdus sp. PtaU1.Bin050]|nr:MAG: hypothetical protein A4E63_02230 [Syntrophorhabdus sp. PtaU1.Bin050]
MRLPRSARNDNPPFTFHGILPFTDYGRFAMNYEPYLSPNAERITPNVPLVPRYTIYE